MPSHLYSDMTMSPDDDIWGIIYEFFTYPKPRPNGCLDGFGYLGDSTSQPRNIFEISALGAE